MKKIAVLSCIIVMAYNGIAGGYQVNLQGHRSLGMGHCATGLFHGPSSLFFNPGAFSMLDSSYIQANVHFIFANTVYQEPYPGTYTASTLPGVGTPFSAYFNFKPKDSKFNFGLGKHHTFTGINPLSSAIPCGIVYHNIRR